VIQPRASASSFFDISPTARYNFDEIGNDASNPIVPCLSPRVLNCAPTGIFIFDQEVSEWLEDQK